MNDSSKNSNHDFEGTYEQYLNDTSFGRPHVVILGAGASLAGFPVGDKNGKKLPLMDDLIEILDLNEILGDRYIGSNIEDVFTTLSQEDKNADLLSEVEKRIFNYFEDFELPDEPTIYDHLVLSLRGKDLIASFNWDPFLFKAIQRNHHVAEMPKIVFLHGNVAIGYCASCPEFGERKGICSKCKNRYKDSDLLYPIGEKDYDRDPITKSTWSVLKKYLKSAYVLSIFGYRAPLSDKKALEIFKEAWGPNSERSLEQLEFIHRPGISDTEIEKVVNPWKPMIHTHHSGSFGSIYDSHIMKYPRRSCESFWSMIMNLKIYPEQTIPNNVSLSELQNWFTSISKHENINIQEVYEK